MRAGGVDVSADRSVHGWSMAAAKAGGFHFRWQDGLWRDSRSGDELFDCLSRLVSQQSGTPVRLAAKAPPG